MAAKPPTPNVVKMATEVLSLMEDVPDSSCAMVGAMEGPVGEVGGLGIPVGRRRNTTHICWIYLNQGIIVCIAFNLTTILNWICSYSLRQGGCWRRTETGRRIC